MLLRKTRFIFGGILLIIFLATLCCTQKNADVPKNVTDILERIEQKYCQDKRLSVFDVQVRKQGNTLVFTGEVLSSEGKAELVTRVFSETKYQVVDSVRVLPDTSLKGEIYGVIKVSVAQLRRHGDFHHEIINQATMGTEVKILKREDGFWVYCQLEDGYLGWLMESTLKAGDENFINQWRGRKKMMVTAMYDQIWEQPRASGKAVSDVVLGNILIDRGRKGSWRRVELVDGRNGYIPSSSIMDLKKMEQIKQDPEKMVELAYRFIGIPYFWGGLSTKGFDCSGFTQTLYKSIGILLPRDANMQVNSGKEVVLDEALNNLQTGDLLFFGKSIDKITHVGMYISDQKFIHSDCRVRINSFNPENENYSEYRRKSLQAVRRILVDN